MKNFFRTILSLAFLLIFIGLTAQDSYRIIFLGDTHFDAEDEKYHPAGVSKASARDIGMWKERLPQLLKAAAKKADANTAFVLQGGDMVEGGSGTAATHTNMLVDGYKCLQGFFPVPFLTVAGNHDISSKVLKGEPQAHIIYRNFAKEHLLPVIKSVKGVSGVMVSTRGTDIAFRYGKDLYFLMNFNGYGTSPDFVKEVLEKNADARYKIILTHAGPVSWDVRWRPNWRLYGNVKVADRNVMLELFQKHNCIFLTGHYHGIASLEYTTEKGSIYQIQGCCVWTPDIPEKVTPIHAGPAEYGKFIQRSKHLNTAQKQALIDFFKPGMKSYYYAKGAGYMTLDISEKEVVVNYFHRAEDTPSCTFRIPKK